MCTYQNTGERKLKANFKTVAQISGLWKELDWMMEVQFNIARNLQIEKDCVDSGHEFYFSRRRVGRSQLLLIEQF